MKKTSLLIAVLFFFFTGMIQAQNISISDVAHTADASAVLDVYSTSLGMLVPRLATAPTNPANGLLYYSTSSNSFFYNEGNSATPSWAELSHGNLWSRTGTDTYLTNFNDNVVIGTNSSSPGYKFYVFGGISQMSRFDGQVEFWEHATGTMSADINSTSGNGAISIYDAANSAQVRFNAIGNSYLTGGNLGIGIANPATLLHLYDGLGGFNPQLIIENPSGAGYASQTYLGTGVGNFCEGLVLVDNTYVLNNLSSLSPGAQSDGATMMKAYPSGIVDFDNQSRTRAFLTGNQPIQPSTWWPIDFSAISYDQQMEFTPGFNGTPAAPAAYFTATEEGYYQVNSRTEFFLGEEGDNYWISQDAYVSIAIFKGDLQGLWNMYAQGNNLQIGQIWNPQGGVPTEALSFKHNNAPNVSDVVYLQKGEKIAIFAWQSNSFSNLDLVPGSVKTYVSIHKSS